MNITDKQYNELVVYIKSNIGIDLGANKKIMVISRLRSAFTKYNINTYNELYKKLIIEKDKVIENVLVNAITTNYTYFMREVDHFKYFQKNVMPQLNRDKRNKDLRIWCAACSSGEEAYTLAMIIDEVLGEDKSSWDRKMLATDISTDMLEICDKGSYPLASLSVLEPSWIKKYFRKISPDACVVSPEIKNQILFRKFNLMTEKYPFKKKFDVIFCRNVMIYFDLPTRMKLIDKFYELLEDGGYLFIGHSESIEKSSSKFNYVVPSVYRKE